MKHLVASLNIRGYLDISKRSIEDPLSSMMLFLRSSSSTLFCSSFDLLYKYPRILLNICVNAILGFCSPWADRWHILLFIVSWLCFWFIDCISAFCDFSHKFCGAVLNAKLFLDLMLLWYILDKYVQTLHINSVRLVSIYYCAKPTCDSSSVSFISFYTILFPLEILVFQCLVLCFSCSRIMVTIIFIMSDSDIKSLGYWLFFID